MPGIFLSHSSVDKAIVRRIAAELLLERIPVWLDQWEMGVGDSLDSSISGGIQRSDYLALFISRASITSGWVEREMQLALAHEKRLGRIFLLPVRLDDAEIPLQIADRLYADFSTSRDNGMRALLRRVRDERIDTTGLTADQTVYPILFLADSVSINADRFERYLNWISQRSVVNPKIVVVNTPALQAEIDKARERFARDIDEAASDHASIEEALYHLDWHIDLLVEGIHLILSEIRDSHTADIVHWFAKNAQMRLLDTLGRYFVMDDPRLHALRKSLVGDHLVFNKILYGSAKMERLDFYDERVPEPTTVSAYVDATEHILSAYRPWTPFIEHCGPDEAKHLGAKYLIPRQIIAWFGAKRRHAPLPPVFWDFAGWRVGLS